MPTACELARSGLKIADKIAWYAPCDDAGMQWYRLALVSFPWLVACQQPELASEPHERPVLPVTPSCPDSPPSALERGRWVKVLENGPYKPHPVCIVGRN